MVRLLATATFEGEVVKVEVKDISSPPQVIGTFVGKVNHALTGISEGTLDYSVLPEGNHTMALSVTDEKKLVIKFYSSGDSPDPEFEGTLFSDPAPDTSGDGTWISMNFHQQVFILSIFSNVIREQRNTLGVLQAIALQIVPAVVSIVGWEVVWGPVVWKNDPDNISGPDHVWFVAKKLTHSGDNIYVVSVAGSTTIYNTLVNNAGIIPVVDFTTWATGAPPTPSPIPLSSTASYVAMGTAVGVHTLESYPAPAGPGAGQTLPLFLKNAPRGSQFIFTGFSLGGTLSPTLGLRLVKADAGIFTDADTVLTYPIAGASPGNVHFADSFAARFPKSNGSGYQVWNSNIANTLDVATNVWSTDESQPLRLDRIRRIYNNVPIAGVEQGMDLATATANKSGIIYIPLQSTLFTDPNPMVPPTNMEQFVKLAELQHSIAYENYFGINLPRASGVEGRLFPDVVIGII